MLAYLTTRPSSLLLNKRLIALETFQTRYLNSEPTGICSFKQRAWWRNCWYQLYSFWYVTAGNRTHDLLHHCLVHRFIYHWRLACSVWCIYIILSGPAILTEIYMWNL